jgi:3-methyl-2-oxobutanoate hydroxymethyltransferase
VLGLFDAFQPKFSKRYCDLGLEIRRAFETYRSEVLAGTFPDTAHSYGLNKDVLAELSHKLPAGMIPKK